MSLHKINKFAPKAMPVKMIKMLHMKH